MSRFGHGRNKALPYFSHTNASNDLWQAGLLAVVHANEQATAIKLARQFGAG